MILVIQMLILDDHHGVIDSGISEQHDYPSAGHDTSRVHSHNNLYVIS